MREIEYKNMSEIERTHFYFKHKRKILRYLYKKYFSNCDPFVFDSACGTGADFPVYNNVIGMDINYYGLNFTKRYNKEVICGDVNNIPIKNDVFDLVLGIDIISVHGIKISDTIDEYHRILKNGGLLFINVPAMKFLFSKHDVSVSNKIRFNRLEIKRVFNNSQWKIKEIFYWNTYLLPIILIQRKLIALFQSYEKASDVRNIYKILNNLFYSILHIEFQLSKKNLLPFGVSLFLVLEKK